VPRPNIVPIATTLHRSFGFKDVAGVSSTHTHPPLPWLFSLAVVENLMGEPLPHTNSTPLHPHPR